MISKEEPRALAGAWEEGAPATGPWRGPGTREQLLA